MNNRRLLATGIVGSAICALGCVTPIFVVALGAVGLSAMTGYLDYVLFPGLAVFPGSTAAKSCKGGGSGPAPQDRFHRPGRPRRKFANGSPRHPIALA